MKNPVTINLQPFTTKTFRLCRRALDAPLCFDRRIYATNGSVAIMLNPNIRSTPPPRRCDELDEMLCERIRLLISEARSRRFMLYYKPPKLPDPVIINACSKCGGKGLGGSLICKECGVLDDHEKHLTMSFHGVHLAIPILRKLSRLDDVLIGISDAPDAHDYSSKPQPFKFRYGSGVIMPCRGAQS